MELLKSFGITIVGLAGIFFMAYGIVWLTNAHPRVALSILAGMLVAGVTSLVHLLRSGF